MSISSVNRPNFVSHSTPVHRQCQSTSVRNALGSIEESEDEQDEPDPLVESSDSEVAKIPRQGPEEPLNNEIE